MHRVGLNILNGKNTLLWLRAMRLWAASTLRFHGKPSGALRRAYADTVHSKGKIIRHEA